ncbi:flagellar export protein FliJ [Alcaligenaceae bacterium CGII-47]|nr:flagellar export protein FliJ [Alcaligenaceae bacterium CGII-47]
MADHLPLSMLIELAQGKLDEAGRALSEAIAQQRHAKSQLDTLDTYRADYAVRLQQATEGGVSASNYHNFRRFIATLDDAISQQNRILAQIDTKIQIGQQHWYVEKRRLNSYETLKSRQDQQMRYRETRREQRASDEISAGLYRRSRQPH